MMSALRVSSSLSHHALSLAAPAMDVLLLRPGSADSIQSLKLAEHLAKSSFKENRNIASKFHLEFLLWLSAKKDISSAIRETAFHNPHDLLLISFKGGERLILKKLDAKKLPLGLKKESAPMELERISLGRITQ